MDSSPISPTRQLSSTTHMDKVYKEHHYQDGEQNYHISATFHTISKRNFRNFAKSFVKKILTLS